MSHSLASVAGAGGVAAAVYVHFEACACAKLIIGFLFQQPFSLLIIFEMKKNAHLYLERAYRARSHGVDCSVCHRTNENKQI